MANWTVSTLYGRLMELIEEAGIKDSDQVSKLKDELRNLIVEEALAGANRKRRSNPKPQLQGEMPGQTAIDAALEE